MSTKANSIEILSVYVQSFLELLAARVGRLGEDLATRALASSTCTRQSHQAATTLIAVLRCPAGLPATQKADPDPEGFQVFNGATLG